MPLHPRDLVLLAGGEALRRFGTLVWRRAPVALGGEGVVESFTRATAGSLIDQDGTLRDVVADVPRISWLESAVGGGRDTPVISLEPVRAQIVPNPEDFTLWVKPVPSPVTGGQGDPRGAAGAYLLEDDTPFVKFYIEDDLSFTGNGTKSLSLRVRRGTATQSSIVLWDNTAVVERHAVNITWDAAGVPQLATQAGAGVLLTPRRLRDFWWEIGFSADGVIAANDNKYRIVVASDLETSEGTVFVFGANAFDASYPGSYQGAGVGTRNADQLTVPLPFALGIDSWSFYIRYVGPRWIGAGVLSGDQALLAISVSANPQVLIMRPADFETIQAQIHDGTATVVKSAAYAATATVPVIRASVQVRNLASMAGGEIRLAVDNSPFSSWSAPGTLSPITALGDALLGLGYRTGSEPGGDGLHVAVVAKGEHSVADFEELLL